jgi:cell division protein FtsQ
MRDTDQEVIARPTFRSERKVTARQSEESQTRSQEVRARHQGHGVFSKTASSNVKGTRSSAQTTRQYRYVAPSRPVVVRGPISSIPLQKKNSSKARRQYHFSLNSMGAELRIPSLSGGLPGWRFLSGVLVFFTIGVIYALFNLPLFQFGPAEITGNNRVAPNDIEAALNTEGTPAISAKAQDIEARLLAAFPDFSSVEVSIGLPASLSISVVERQPIISWVQGDTTSWVDQSGNFFPVRGEAGSELITIQADYTPLISVVEPGSDTNLGTDVESQTSSDAAITDTAITTKPFLSEDLVSTILTLGSIAPSGSTMVYSAEHGLGWLDPQGWEVYFGSNVDDLDLKITEYEQIITDLKQKGITPVLVSVEFIHAPFYRLEQ